MKKNDNAIFKQAFDELEDEGYFNDISAKIKKSRVSTTVKPKVYAYTVKNAKKTRRISKASKEKIRAR